MIEVGPNLLSLFDHAAELLVSLAALYGIYRLVVLMMESEE